MYAKAFMGVAAKTSNTEALVEELKSIVADVLDRFPKLEEVFKSSLVSPEQKEALLDRVFSKAASIHVTNFLKVLARHGRLEIHTAHLATSRKAFHRAERHSRCRHSRRQAVGR